MEGVTPAGQKRASCPVCHEYGFVVPNGLKIHISRMHKDETPRVPNLVAEIDMRQGDGNVNPYKKGDEVRLEPGAVWNGGPGPDEVGTVMDVSGDNVQVSWDEHTIEWLGVDDLRPGAKDIEPDALVVRTPSCRVEFTLLVTGSKEGADVRDLVLRMTDKFKQHGLFLTELVVLGPKRED